MIKSLVNLFDHMLAFHPDAQYWGDSGVIGQDGRMKTQKCFLCGVELIKDDGIYKTNKAVKIEVFK